MKRSAHSDPQKGWPSEWMDALPSALFLMEGQLIVLANDRGCFLLGIEREFKPFNWLESKLFDWREEDKSYYIDRWGEVDPEERVPIRMELELRPSSGQRFQCEVRLSPGPNGKGLLQLVDISEQRFRQQALQDREAHYRRLTDVAQEGILLVQDEVVLDVNSRFLVMMGLEHAEEVVGDRIAHLGFQRLGNLEPIKGSGVFDRADWNLTNRHGDVLHLDIGKGRLEDGSEVWMMYDVTDRKKIEFDLVQERERFRLLVQSSPNGIIILVDGMIRYVNPVAESLFADSEGELEGKRFSELFSGTLSQRVEESAKKTRQGSKIDEWEVELGPNNSRRLMLKWRLTIFDGQPAVQVNLSDVTDRYALMQERIRAEMAEGANEQLTKEIEQRIAVESALKSATARMRSIVESGEDFIIWTQAEEYVVTSGNVNFRNWLGMESIVGEEEKMCELLRSRISESLEHNGFDVNDRFLRALNGRPQRFEWALSLEEDGKEKRWLQMFLNPIEVAEGNKEISAIAYDITERKRIDRRIREALKEKEILLQEVHHRVKNNLQIIHSILNLQKKFVDDDKTIVGLEEIQNRVSTMSIIHETLYQNTDVSRIGFPAYITRIAGNIIQGYQSGTSVELITDLDDLEAPLDQAIPCGLILNEWVSNAMKYAFKGKQSGTITVRLKAADVEGDSEMEEIRIEVEDDGVGLPEGFDWSTRDSLGLYLVQALSEQLDADLKAESEGGARFLIRFRRRKNMFDGD
ncbi:MAG: PAS domain S-box protein [Flavobacteriales bacterium]|nr:PAS domain S-box protein [Flavobacteriales bacterium]